MNEQHLSETKLMMAGALKELIKTRAFSKVTVSDIVAACNINRNTFYYHFENNYDLLYFTYEQEVQNIVNSFREAQASLPQALDFVFDYIDKNLPLCQCAYESLGENELKNIFERDLAAFTNSIIEYFSQELSVRISEDYKTFLSFNYRSIVSAQIVWYIKFNEHLDKARFKDYIHVVFFVSLKSAVEEGGKRNL